MCAHMFSAVQNLGRPYWLTLSPMYLWMLVFFTRPHKEERFLFPIYPLICLSGAVALSSLQVCLLTKQQSVLIHFISIRLLFIMNVHVKWFCLQINFISCRNATTSCFSGTDWSTTRCPPTGWLLAQSWSSQCCRCLALSLSSEVRVPTDTFLLSTSGRQHKLQFSVYRLPRSSGPVPRIPSHR